ncbi:hypothetical protein DB32_000980 [Sandaracinus amylolyticus]|uniref:Uncharacterized protein n=2 Tax=Sandaracinus amylolyticus TaxID=927083 RepID=A0A0F6VZT0_9BACT|nr:hypothetical protein DB32_000980 [Sandaracinus amylolyticus]
MVERVTHGMRQWLCRWGECFSEWTSYATAGDRWRTRQAAQQFADRWPGAFVTEHEEMRPQP